MGFGLLGIRGEVESRTRSRVWVQLGRGFGASNRNEDDRVQVPDSNIIVDQRRAGILLER